MAAEYTFQGWLGHSAEAAQGKMEWGTFEPKTWTENDVDIQISHCGVCGSDVHTLGSGWGETKYPCCVGHEIVGKAIRVGSNVKHISVGDRVGVGAQSGSCLEPDCPDCTSGRENYCGRLHVGTYNGQYPNNEGKSYGGYADYNRANGRFVVKIPDGLPSEHAAPLLCGGVTMYAPLRQKGCGPGKRVGIVGVGGLGHFGVLIAKALGADKVVGISRRASKRDEVLSLGADEYIATADDENWAEKNKRSLDIIISTVSNANMPLDSYLELLDVNGSFVQVGLPDGGKLPNITVWPLIKSAISIGGSLIGSPKDMEEVLELAAKTNMKPWVELRPLEEANQAVVDLEAGKPRYRYVLVNSKHL